MKNSLKAIKKVLSSKKIDVSKVKETTNLFDDLKLDQEGILDIVMDLEESNNITIENEEIIMWNTISDMVNTLDKSPLNPVDIQIEIK